MPRWTLLGVVLLIAIGAAIAFPLFTRWRETGGRHPGLQCLGNVKNLSLAVQLYVTDYDRVPDPRAWSDLLMPYVATPDTYRCPKAPDLRCAYAFNDGAAAQTNHSLNEEEARSLVTIFESNRGWNAHGGRDLLPAKPRHLDGDHYGFLDGHAQWLQRGDSRVQWRMEAPGRPRGGRPLTNRVDTGR